MVYPPNRAIERQRNRRHKPAAADRRRLVEIVSDYARLARRHRSRFNISLPCNGPMIRTGA